MAGRRTQGRKKKIGSNHNLNHELFMEGFNTMHSYFLRVIARDVISFVANNSSKDPRQIYININYSSSSHVRRLGQT